MHVSLLDAEGGRSNTLKEALRPVSPRCAAVAWSFAQKLVVSLFVLLVLTAVVAYVYGKPPEHVELRIGLLKDYPTTLFLAEQYGLGARYGIVLKLVRFDNVSALMGALDEGKVNMVILPPHLAAQRLLEKGDLVVVAIDLLDDSGVVALRSLNLTNSSMLGGLSIGAYKASAEYKLFAYLYEKLYNSSVDTLNIVDLSYKEVLDAAGRGEISAAIVKEPYISILQSDYNFSQVESIASMMGKYLKAPEQMPFTLILASSKLAAEKPEGLDSFVKLHEYAATIWQERADLDEQTIELNLNLTPSQAALLAANMPAWTQGLTDNAVQLIRNTWKVAWEAGLLKQNPEKLGDQFFWI